MRVLIDPSSHHLLNAGDVAMLQVCVDRLRELRPHAEIQALTTAPDLLRRYCPGVDPIDARGRYELTAGGVRLAAPRPMARMQLRATARRMGRRQPAATRYVSALLQADVLVMSGRGGLTDAFRDESEAMLIELQIADRIGLPTVLLGQGLGPLEDSRLRQLARTVLPSVAMISLREGRAAPAFLSVAGVPASRVSITGDDAIASALEARHQALLNDALGLNVRVADYSAIAPSQAEAVGAATREVAHRLGTRIVRIDISAHPHENEWSVHRGREEIGQHGPEAGTPAGAIAAAGRCRLVVVSSYHAAVFALSQGVPAIGLANSPYYVDKFLGLRERFGDGCAMVRLDRTDGVGALTDEIARMWKLAPTLHDSLVRSAEEQVVLSRAAYERLVATVDGASPQRSSQGSGGLSTPSEPVRGAHGSM